MVADRRHATPGSKELVNHNKNSSRHINTILVVPLAPNSMGQHEGLRWMARPADGCPAAKELPSFKNLPLVASSKQACSLSMERQSAIQGNMMHFCEALSHFWELPAADTIQIRGQGERMGKIWWFGPTKRGREKPKQLVADCLPTTLRARFERNGMLCVTLGYMQIFNQKF